MIANRFELLGPGPAGSTRARDQGTAQTVVLMDAPRLERRLARVFHPALLSTLAIVEHEGRNLAATEFVQSKPLSELFADVPCSPRRAAEVVSETADGVAELHARDLQHGRSGFLNARLNAPSER